MPWSLVEIYASLPAFLLVLFRVGGLMMSAPLFSSSVLPMRIKVLMALAIAITVFPLLIGQVTIQVTLASAVVGLLGELAIGLFLGFGLSLIFMGAQMAGQLIGQQAGMALGSVFDPMLESETTVLSQLYFFVAMMVFLSVGGHHAAIRALLDSFETVPPLQFQVTEHLVALLVEMLALAFTIAIRIAGPVVLSLMLAFLTLGLISRTIPQLNILTIGFPIKLSVALIVMALTVMSLESVLIDALSLCMDGIRAGLGLPPIS